jgi:ATP-dependent Clp protease ATP-binding subunit ClpA
LPRPEKDIVEASKKRVRPEPEVRRAKARKLKSDDDEGGPEGEPDDDGPDEGEGVEDEASDETTSEGEAKPSGIVPNVPLQG